MRWPFSRPVTSPNDPLRALRRLATERQRLSLVRDAPPPRRRTRRATYCQGPLDRRNHVGAHQPGHALVELRLELAQEEQQEHEHRRDAKLSQKTPRDPDKRKHQHDRAKEHLDGARNPPMECDKGLLSSLRPRPRGTVQAEGDQDGERVRPPPGPSVWPRSTLRILRSVRR